MFLLCFSKIQGINFLQEIEKNNLNFIDALSEPYEDWQTNNIEIKKSQNSNPASFSFPSNPNERLKQLYNFIKSKLDNNRGTCLVIDGINVLLNLAASQDVLIFLQYCNSLVQRNPV